MKLLDSLGKLPYFSAVAKAGSFSEASKRLRVSQPSLSISVATLESALNCKLFVRSGRGVMLTEEGKTLFDFTARLATMANEVETKIHSVRQELDVHLRIGTHESISIYFFPEFLRYPESDLSKDPDLAENGSQSHRHRMAETG